jgi:hypothetical protein
MTAVKADAMIAETIAATVETTDVMIDVMAGATAANVAK